jgi:predicted ferric reductase
MRRGITTKPLTASVDDDAAEVPYTVRPMERMSFTWNPPRNESGRYFLNGTFNFSNGIYVAVGFRSSKKMEGPIILCAVNNSDSRASCNDFMGSEYSITKRDLSPAEEVNITEAWKVGDTVFIRFEKLVVDPDLNLSDIELDGYARWIFARGKWYPERPSPSQHETDQKGVFFVNFMTGNVEKIESKKYVIVLAVACVSVGLVSLWLSLMRARHTPLSDRHRLALGIGLLCAYCILVFAYILVNYLDYLTMITSKAFYRAVGDGAVLCFASLMFPVSRRVFLGFFGIPPERAIKYHTFSSLLLIIVSAIHGIGMWSSFNFTYLLRWRDKDGVSMLPGLIAFLFLLIITVVSLLRNLVSYRMHRAVHYLYIPCIFFGACHATALTYALAPAAIFLFLTFLHKKLAMPVGEVEDALQCAVSFADSSCVVLDFTRNDYLRPGSWYFLSIPAIGIAQHPFFVARSRQTSNSCSVRLVIKDTRKTNLRKDSIGWTGCLLDFLSAKKPIESYILDGPYGIAEVDPFNFGNYVFVCGGIGIVPLVHMLQILSLSSGDGHDEDIIGAVKLKANILFLWVIPNESLLAIFGEDLSAYHTAIENASKHLKLSIKVFVTGSQAPPPGASPRAPPRAITLEKGRPKLAEELVAFERQQAAHYVKTADNTFTTLNRGAMYMCGPRGLVDDARLAAKSLTTLRLDTSEFQFLF